MENKQPKRGKPKHNKNFKSKAVKYQRYQTMK